MSLFITPENQKSLWNVISQNDLVNNFFFYNSSKLNREDWFKSILELFYEENKHRALNKTDLLLLNKQTISYMIQNIKNSAAPQQKEQINQETFLQSYSITENKVEKIGNQYNEKQTEYNAMFGKKVPDAVEFGEKQDVPLSNMDELIKQHLREREDELVKYAPLPLIQHNKLKIDNESSSDNISIQIEEIKEIDRAKKSVSWLDTTVVENLQKDMELLKIQVNDLMEKVKILEKENRI